MNNCTRASAHHILCVTTFFLAAPLAASAQEQGGQQLTEITVTAERVAENEQKVPISLTAFDGSQLAERGIKDLSALTEFVPNLNFLTSTGASSSSAAFAFIRGIGQTNPFLQNDPGVGTYIDGVYIGRTQGGVFDILNLQRVEVLRGPQGTLYGQNTIGGAINLITNPPSSKFGVSGFVEGGNYNTINSQATINVPISDVLFASLAVGQRYHEGYVQPIINSACPTCTTEALSNRNSFATRLAVRFVPSERFALDFSADFSHQKDLPFGVRLLTYNLVGPGPGGVVGPLLAGYDATVQLLWGRPTNSFINPAYNTSQSGFAGSDDQQVWGTALTATWTMPGYTVKSITAYRTMKVSTSNDGDGAPVGLFANAYDFIHQDQFSEELQMSSKAFDDHLDWLAGIFGWKENANETNQFAIYQETDGLHIPQIFFPFPQPCPTWDPADPPFNGNCGNNGEQYTNLATVSGAAYANATWHFNSSVSLTAGARYTYDKKTFYYSQVGQPTELTDTSQTWNHFTPRVVLEDQLTPQALLYASFSEGFKSGNFNNGNYVATGGSRAVAPETAHAYELGTKTAWLDQRMIANLALFYTNYHDQQLQITVPPPPPGLHAFINAGASRIYGGEFEFQARPSQYLRFNASAGYTNTKITEVAPNTIGASVNSQLPYTPKWNGTVGAEVTLPFGEAALDLRGDWSYVGAQNGDALDTEALVTPGRAVTNFRASFGPNKGHWQVYAFVQNAFNKEYRSATYAAFVQQFSVGIDGPPRTYGGGVRFDF